MSSITLFYAPICPFAHRAWLVAEELGLTYDAKEANLKAKQPWFTEAYRAAEGADVKSDGKVPVLFDGDFKLAESGIIARYLLNKYDADAGKFKLSPVQEARGDLFTEQVASKLVSGYYKLLMAQEEDKREEGRALLLAGASALAQTVAKHGGPYLLGDHPALPDFMVWPFIARLGVVKHYRDFEVPSTPEYAAYHSYVATMRSRAAVTKTQMPDEFYVEGYASYANPTPAAST